MADRRLISAAVLLTAGSAQAECLGSCADALAGALIAIVIYGVLGIVVLVMLIRAKWRRAGLWVLISVTVVAVGLPLLSQAWVAWKLKGTVGRELVGSVPNLDTKATLLVTDSLDACYYDPCGLFVQSRGERGTFALQIDAMREVDLGKPLDLSELPLEFWLQTVDGSNTPRSRPLTPQEQEATRAIDYLVVLRKNWFSEDQGPVEAALKHRPGLEGLRETERANIVMGPVVGGKLDLVGMKLDLLDLRLLDSALALILAPHNTQEAGNEIAGRATVVDLLCGEAAVSQGWDCEYILD